MPATPNPDFVRQSEPDAPVLSPAAHAPTDIPGAREILEATIRRMHSIERMPGQDKFIVQSTAELRNALSVALAKMKRVNTKPSVKSCRSPIFDSHRKELTSLVVKENADNLMTCAEIAVMIFGEPSHLGWISEAIARVRNGKAA